MKRASALPPSLSPRNVRREAAAEYVGVSPSKFDQLVSSGRMPKPFRIDGCVLWAVRALDSACASLEAMESEETGWEDVA